MGIDICKLYNKNAQKLSNKNAQFIRNRIIRVLHSGGGTCVNKYQYASQSFY